MPRPPRLQVENGIYHVVSRGVRRTTIFHDDEDRRFFLGLLAHVVETYRWRCFAYCLMGNHFHLGIRTIEPTISRGMQWLNSRYCQGYSIKYARPGHALERRFWSELIVSDAHLLETVRYIPLNPVRSGICGDPSAWWWSSYAATAGLVPAPKLLDAEWALELFAPERSVAVRRYVQFVADGVDLGHALGLTQDVSRRVVALAG